MSEVAEATGLSPGVEAPRLVSLRRVCDKTSLSETSLRRLWESGDFPKPIRITRNRIAWLEPRVDAWIVAKASSQLEAA